MSAGPEEGLNRRSLVSLSVIAGGMWPARYAFPEGENNEMDFCFLAADDSDLI